ncbi:ATP-dependent Clp protease ATP-binding subunit ClpX [Photobacterium kishitanii]|uniref:ATP-dependent Clp protease ATP-binding subunit ClpX n=1 Tax=Photobacterium kishitanii TaxID=318456 RepID=A0A2T3KM46_9GAMM|nr:ATP-dependent Clp protease ATP-binding subunit ClpX [Photobacterium kishitanii]PSV00873.1 ATP-dependent Clp protease ATP-binding subunit ClpX [Photobacterium kishitanii]
MTNVVDIETCSFCGANKKEKKLVGSDISYICEDCTDLVKSQFKSNAIQELSAVQNKEDLKKIFAGLNHLKPANLKAILDKQIVSQEQAKKLCSLALYEHLKRKAIHKAGDKVEGVTLDKPNMLLLGSTGVGKTEISRILTKSCNLPMVTIDCTSLTEAGYVGDSVDDIIRSLLVKADDDVEAAEWGIVFLDEVDKLCSRHSVNTTADVGGQGVQDALLKLIEGTEIRVQSNGGRKTSGSSQVVIDTSNILFISSGAFTGIDEKQTPASIGFLRKDHEKEDAQDPLSAYDDIEVKDIVKFGLSPEFIGRFSILVPFKNLSRDDLVSILKNADNSVLKKITFSAYLDGTDLEFSDEALIAIADVAAKLKVGARALSQVLYRTLEDIRYNSSNAALGSVLVTKEMVLDKNKGINNNEPK